MVTRSFYLKKERLGEFKQFIRTQTSSVRFVCNPYLEGDKYYVKISSDIKDSNKLNELFEKYYIEDNPKPIKKESFIDKIKKFLCLR
jgi:hypothetical protein